MSTIHSKKNLLKRTAKLEKELAAKSYGLKIESALEKVSIAAMSLRKSKDLSGIGSLIFKELKKLGFTDLRNTEIVINNNAKETITSYYYSDYGVTGVIELDYKSNAIVKGWADQLKKASNAFAEVVIPEKEMKAWRKYREEIGYLPDAKLNKAKTVYYYSYSTGTGALSISSFKPLSKEQIKILKRFRNVFNLSYQRYIDVTKAEAQAKEAEIELALERVRAKTMAMQKSEELQETTLILFQQFKSLGVTTAQVSICVFDEDIRMGEMFVTLKGEKIERSFPMELDKEVFVMKKAKKAFLDKQKKFSFIVKGKELQDYNHWRNSLIGRKGWDESKAIRKQSWYVNGVFFSRGLMGFSSDVPSTDETLKLLDRFAQVFDLTFTRFLDLQKAEAQAKEAQLETALEKVRSRSLAMRKSDEIQQVIVEIFTRLNELGVGTDSANILIFEDQSNDIECWTASNIGGYQRAMFPYADLDFLNDLIEAKRSGTELFSKYYTKEQKNAVFSFFFEKTELRSIPEERKAFVLQGDGYSVCIAFCHNIGINLNRYSDSLYSEGDKNILKRFSKVFDQSYTRFLDLQKAEAQARQAQIELGLERVRNRAMAMRSSEELNALIGTVFTELTKLDLVLTRCVILIYEGNEKGVRWWMANSEAPSVPTNFFVKYADIPFFNEYLKGWQERLLKWQYILEGENKFNTDEFLFKETELSQLPDFVIAGMRAPGRVYLNASFNNFGNLTLASLEPLSDEHFDILLRFAKVFDLTYTRFNDLKQAEAQAREAQIELALERVRARTMAMQKSDELAEAAQLLYHEFGTLGINTITCGYMFIDEEKNIQTAWTVLPDGTLLPNFIDFPLTGDQVLNKRYEDWKQKKPLHIFEIQGEVNKEHHKFLSKYVPPFVVKDIFSQLPDKIVFHCANFSSGYLLILATDYFSPDDQQTIIRFARVFEMTYRRFLDLQKAEAQVKESRIQLALERVRARTMAMHKSEELAEVAEVLYNQLKDLGDDPERITIGIMSEESRVITWWATDQGGSKLNIRFQATANEPTVMLKLYNSWKAKHTSLVVDLTGAELSQWVKYCREVIGVPIKEEILQNRRVQSAGFFSHGCVMITSPHLPDAATINILERFTTVFGLTYRRFLDLQRAEAQAREAQIEAALERVRARSMAMHHSTELHDAADVLFQQLRLFGGNIMNAGIALCKQDADEDEYWLSSNDGLRPVISIPHTEDAIQKKLYEDWKNKSEFYSIAKGGDELRAHYNYMQSVPHLKPFFEEGSGWSFPTWQKWHAAYFSHGYLFMITLEPYEEEKILVRFAKVFEQAYTRFLDLQKAEAQAREAQIEAALERVRSKAMAMHNSADMSSAASIVFAELRKVGINPIRSGVGLLSKEDHKAILYGATTSEKGDDLSLVGWVMLVSHPIFAAQYEKWLLHEDYFPVLENEEIKKYYEKLSVNFSVPVTHSNEKQYGHFLMFTHGFLFCWSQRPYEEAEIRILRRFASVIDLTFNRYFDLQKAEAQARESQIEAALERVRSKAMAMHNSADLSSAASVVFTELKKLGIRTIRSGISLQNKENRKNLLYTSTSTDKEENLSLIGWAVLDDHPILKEIYDSWIRGEDYFPVLKGEVLKSYYEKIKSTFKVPTAQSKDYEQHGYFMAFTHGMFYGWAEKPFDDNEKNILKRFASVVDLTFKRYFDLQKAEGNAREAQIETSLERVRSKTMAMHNSNDVGETVATMFAEFVHLGIHTNRCGILIFNDQHLTEVWTARSTPGGNAKLIIGKLDLDAHKMLRSVFNAWKAKETFYQYDLLDNDLVQYYTAINNSKFYPTQFDLNALPSKEFNSAFFFTDGGVFSFTNEPVAEEHAKIIKRFAGVFGQTYRRYLDLQKAEAQAREAQIEASLERVRASAMAMHHSDELSNVLAILFEQFDVLKIQPVDVHLDLFDLEKNTFSYRATGKEGKRVIAEQIVDLDSRPEWQALLQKWKNGKPNTVDFSYYPKEVIRELMTFFPDIWSAMPEDAIMSPEDFPEGIFDALGYCKFGYIGFHHHRKATEEEQRILTRFANEFERLYQRFLDLQKAEAQAREAQIEVGLERVRARTMAMHSSEDVSIATATMFSELEKLGVENFRGGITNLLTNRTQDVWSVSNLAEEKVLKAVGAFDIDAHPFWQLMFKEWEAKKDFLHYFLAGQEKEDYIKILNATQGYLPQAIQQFPDVHFQVYYFNEGGIWTNSLQPHSEEDKQVMKRFTSVFSLTFRRYQDLKKAEAQAKEAQIETSLERVRSKTMAMHSSDDVTSAIATMFTELDRLGIENMRCGIAHYLEDHKMEVWSVSNLADGKVVRGAGLLDTNSIPFWKIFYSTWQKKEDFLYYLMAGKEKEDYFKKINTLQNYLSQSIEDVPDLSIQTYYFSEGSVWAFSLKPHTEEDKQVMKRFASVFSLTFRRYQDLKKAEAQAREATIEAALEKVRGKAMAMHNSNDLSVTTSMVFTELRKLGINPIRCGVGLLNKESRKGQLYSATSSADGDSLSLVGWVILSEHPVLEKIYESWLDDEEYYPQLQGEQMRSYYQLLLRGLPVAVPDIDADRKQFGTFLPFSVGCLYAWSEAPYSETEIKILKRFATIIDLTFRRYIELQTSETSARETVKQAALDRIRADIASMRTVADLDRITPLIWNELTILGLPFIRCGVFIMDNSQQLIHTFLSTPDGKAIGAFHLPYDTPGNFSVMLKHWLDKETYISRWDEIDFIGIAEILVQQGSIASKEQYLTSLPKGGFYLHFLPFLQGMLYVGNSAKLNDEQIELIQHVADAFSTAYARYEDFNKLEAAKQQVEKTLTDLKQAQTQLVQSEKMASLGELTAGIAHEIQNPLNFVNNFSDVSNELLDEMKEELAKGNIRDAIAIAEDVRQNLEKINHHGKRADGIVKGMLQHSRTSSGQKEMTDINALADEYLRLAYHGLRAKEKSFNAKFETDFDTSIEKINIIPQEIGRVILNLINNAFYAVSERRKAEGIGYEPTVAISTVSIQPPLGGRSVQVKVADNGGGIPQKILDKVFQPFFTTKPTGQGTGLGLSLAYDIIKAHGGDIRVATKEGEGSEFTIQLPVV